MVKIVLKLVIDVTSFSKLNIPILCLLLSVMTIQITFQQKLYIKSLQMFDIQSSTLIYGAIRDHELPFKKS